jgi:hypothetical protein
VFHLKLPVRAPLAHGREAGAVGSLVMLSALAIVVVPSGMGGVRVSQVSGTLNGTLYPGTHLVAPLMHQVEVFNIRDQILNTSAFEPEKGSKAPAALKVYSKRGCRSASASRCGTSSIRGGCRRWRRPCRSRSRPN